MISTAAVKKALGEISKHVPRYDEIAKDLAFDADRFLKHLASAGAEAPFDAVLPPLDIEEDRSYEWAGRTLIALLAVKRAGLEGKPEIHEGDLALAFGESRWVPGDLHVKGAVDLDGGLLVVGGNLVVDGRWHDAQASTIVVGGDLESKVAVHTEGFLAAAGCVTAPFVYLDFNQGFAKILGGVKARLFLEHDHGGSRVFGPTDVEYGERDECVIDDGLVLPHDADDDTQKAEALAKLLAPDLAPAIAAALEEGSVCYHLAGVLVDRLGAGGALFRD